MLEVIQTKIPDVKRITPKRFADSRGFFSETWNRRGMEEAGIFIDFVQDNHSYSAAPGTVRGLHYQSPPMGQTKLVRVARGAIRDVAVDVRRGSPTFGRWVAEELSAENGIQLLIPVGFLHGFITLVPDTHVLYKVDNFYDPACDRAVRFDDPRLAIDWGIDPADAILSGKDASAPAFGDFATPFAYEAV
ncbi:dTDP-4-dehydrorhamnose 3,5-epimerase [Limibaculum sp. FT325]|uniref:dTDP-4-dehydrorhamnose 3,5-epimerase n=1 Tax=Thermohalobaculum sediminis TaxID=2939436 RepID=UPI0020C0045F|nr:dTDP-4-dehydrorhamnose 3,5-epimerase [Limibaculum sediminis]MCL5777436.1 dTDP-4-dehydrorhamnose 3,5-epimerase [Limibaculum sediminis]